MDLEHMIFQLVEFLKLNLEAALDLFIDLLSRWAA